MKKWSCEYCDGQNIENKISCNHCGAKRIDFVNSSRICDECGSSIGQQICYRLNSRKFSNKVFCSERCSDAFRNKQGLVFRIVQPLVGL